MPRSFGDVTRDLEEDGSLRDFLVLGTGATDWNCFLKYLEHRSGDGLTFQVGGEIQTRILTFEEIAQLVKSSECLLSITVADSILNCHFFCESEIELDFWPQDFSTHDRWSMLTDFLQQVVDVIGKPGVVTYENSPDFIIESFEPQNLAS